jgi:ribosomal protein L32E
MKKETDFPSNKPVYRITQGAVSASIRRQETEKVSMFKITFHRSHKDGEAWKNPQGSQPATGRSKRREDPQPKSSGYQQSHDQRGGAHVGRIRAADRGIDQG